MKLRILLLLICFVNSSIFANKPAQIDELLHNQREQTEKKIEVPAQLQKPTLIEQIQYVLIATSPLWVPIAVPFLIDCARGYACDKIADRLDRNIKLIDYGFLQIKDRDVTRICLEAGSHSLLYAILNGRIENGSFKPRIDHDIINYTMDKTIDYTVQYCIIPKAFREFNNVLNSFPVAGNLNQEKRFSRYHFENDLIGKALGQSWRAYTWYGAYSRMQKMREEMKQAEEMQEKSTRS